MQVWDLKIILNEVEDMSWITNESQFYIFTAILNVEKLISLLIQQSYLTLTFKMLMKTSQNGVWKRIPILQEFPGQRFLIITEYKNKNLLIADNNFKDI